MADFLLDSLYLRRRGVFFGRTACRNGAGPEPRSEAGRREMPHREGERKQEKAFLT